MIEPFTVITIFLLLVFIALFFILRPNFNLSIFSDKLLVYFCAEMSFGTDHWNEYSEKILSKKPFNIMPTCIFRSILTSAYDKSLRIGMAYFAITFIAMVLAALIAPRISNPAFHFISTSMLNIVFYLPLPLSIALFYARMISCEFSKIENHIENTIGYITSIKLIESREDIDSLIERIKIDFDVYKTGEGLGAFLLFIATSVILLYLKIQESLPSYLIIMLMLFILPFALARSIYMNHRFRTIHIALQACYLIKRSI